MEVFYLNTRGHEVEHDLFPQETYFFLSFLSSTDTACFPYEGQEARSGTETLLTENAEM